MGLSDEENPRLYFTIEQCGFGSSTGNPESPFPRVVAAMPVVAARACFRQTGIVGYASSVVISSIGLRHPPLTQFLEIFSGG